MIRRSLRFFLLSAFVWIGAGPAIDAEEALPVLPALTLPASETRLPGKFVWADLFTSEFDAARQFYADTFGWEWRWISRGPEHRYGIFYSDGEAVAGVAHRAAPEPDKPYARWIYYASVADVKSASADTLARGGRVLLDRRSIPNRGDFAVVADAEGAPFGVLHSSSGDPPDYRAELGEWLWVGLFSRDAEAASKFYASLFGYEIVAPEAGGDILEYVLAAEGHSRAGIGQLRPESESRPTWLGVVRVDDVGATLERARRAGGEVLYEADQEDLAGQLTVVADPFGGIVGLMRWAFEEAAPADEETPP